MKLKLEDYLGSIKELPKEVSKGLEYVGHGDQQGFKSWLDSNAKEGKIPQGDYNFYKANGFGYDYDFNLAYSQGLTPSVDKGDGKWHWPDAGKKPNHQTFSTESVYSGIPGARPGRWDERTGAFIPPVPEKDIGKGLSTYSPSLGWSPVQPSKDIQESLPGARDQSESLLFKMMKGISNSSINLAKKHLDNTPNPFDSKEND